MARVAAVPAGIHQLEIEVHEIDLASRSRNVVTAKARRVQDHVVRSSWSRTSATKAACSSGSPPEKVTPPSPARKRSAWRLSNGANSAEVYGCPDVRVPDGVTSGCGSGERPSGLWHQEHRSGQPFRKTVVRRPGTVVNREFTNIENDAGLHPRVPTCKGVPGDDVILVGLVQFAEIPAPAPHADDQVPCRSGCRLASWSFATLIVLS